MTYFKHHLGECSKGVIVEVIISGPAYVRLIDTKNFHRYRLGRSFDYWGGIARKSPLRFRIPENGRYFVIVDTNGIGGKVDASVQIFSHPLPGAEHKSDELGVVELPEKYSEVIDYGV